MNTSQLFNAIDYFKNLGEKNVLAHSLNFKPCVCSGINSLPDVLAQQARYPNLWVVDDTNNGRSFRTNGAGFYLRRTYTIFILMQYRRDDMDDRDAKLSICRQIFLQTHARMLHDRQDYDTDLWRLNVDDVYSTELGEMFITGCTGLYFTIDAEEPVNLCYNSNEWLP